MSDSCLSISVPVSVSVSASQNINVSVSIRGRRTKGQKEGRMEKKVSNRSEGWSWYWRER